MAANGQREAEGCQCCTRRAAPAHLVDVGGGQRHGAVPWRTGAGGAGRDKGMIIMARQVERVSYHLFPLCGHLIMWQCNGQGTRDAAPVRGLLFHGRKEVGARDHSTTDHDSSAAYIGAMVYEVTGHL